MHRTYAAGNERAEPRYTSYFLGCPPADAYREGVQRFGPDFMRQPFDNLGRIGPLAAELRTRLPGWWVGETFDPLWPHETTAVAEFGDFEAALHWWLTQDVADLIEAE